VTARIRVMVAVAPAPFNAYLLTLLCAAACSRRRPPTAPAGSGVRFAVVVPARDEEASIAATLASLRALEPPPKEVVVVADNCSDHTADVAHAAGVTVWARTGGDGGKGAALAWALERLARTRPEVGAVVIVDADCTVAPNLLAAVDARLRDGAEAVQVAYRVANPGASSVAALRYASFTLVNDVRPLGKATLGFSAGLFGTGMAFSRELLARRPWTARSLVEDQEHHLALVAQGERVAFAPETFVLSAMPTSLRRARSQQLRWEAGRAALIRAWTPRLLAAGVRRRDMAPIHAALEPLIPPQSLLLAVNAVSWLLTVPAGRGVRRVALANVAGQIAFVLGGLALMRAPAPVWRALAFAPVLATWKLGLLARLWIGRGPTSWVRTARERQPPGSRESDASSSRRPDVEKDGS
jgi:1,2-diacylglycerol 3-beta-glucosyltransferase